VNPVQRVAVAIDENDLILGVERQPEQRAVSWRCSRAIQEQLRYWASLTRDFCDEPEHGALPNHLARHIRIAVCCHPAVRNICDEQKCLVPSSSTVMSHGGASPLPSGASAGLFLPQDSIERSKSRNSGSSLGIRLVPVSRSLRGNLREPAMLIATGVSGDCQKLVISGWVEPSVGGGTAHPFGDYAVG
jgi:hypothetical protein